MKLRILILAVLLVPIVGCESIYYNSMEKVGYHKRDILRDRIEDAKESQEESKEQFKSALEELKALTNFDGGDLEKTYNRLKDEFEASEEAAKEIRDRIAKVEDVSEDLFEEWEKELTQYSNQNLKRNSQRQLRDTKTRYKKLIKVMYSAESKIEPVINVLRDQVLYLKHNLNAQAISSLKMELTAIQGNVDQLVKAMQRSIDESDMFIKQLGDG